MTITLLLDVHCCIFIGELLTLLLKLLKCRFKSNNIVSFIEGQLRHTKTGEPFVFNYREDLHRWNQKRYEALGEVYAV